MNLEFFLAGFWGSLGLWVTVLALGAAFGFARRLMK